MSIADFPNNLPTKKMKDNFTKVFDELELRSSPCRFCYSRIDWGFRYCIFCGMENQDFDPEFLDDSLYNRERLDVCTDADHEELHDPDETEDRYCSTCGIIV